jgi:integrase
MANSITGTIDEHVGAKVNVHLFRSFIACLMLKDPQCSLNDVRLLLGHKSFETTLKHYAYLDSKTLAGRQATAIRRAWFPGKRR